jgi:thioredoxin 1
MKTPFSELINSDQPVLVDFYADWCGPCKMMEPVIQELAKKFKEKIKIIKIDVDKNQQVSLQYGVRGVPTFILFKKGEILWQQSGAVPGHQLENIIQNKLNQ